MKKKHLYIYLSEFKTADKKFTHFRHELSYIFINWPPKQNAGDASVLTTQRLLCTRMQIY